MVRSTAQDSAPISTAGLAHTWQLGDVALHCSLSFIKLFYITQLGSGVCFLLGPWLALHQPSFTRSQCTEPNTFLVNSRQSPGLGLQTLGLRVSVQLVLHH